MTRNTVVAVLLACATLAAHAQFRPDPVETVDLRVRLVPAGNRGTVEMARVEVLNTVNSVVLEGYTDKMGRLDFQRRLSPGFYKLRISGLDIETTSTDQFLIDASERVHTMTVEVRFKPGRGPTAAAGQVPVEELRIPRDASREFEEGMKAVKQRKVDEAIAHFRAAVRLHPQYPSAHNNLGVLLVRAGKPDEARAAFEQAIAADERFVSALVNLAKVAYDAKDLDTAEKTLHKAVAIPPAEPEALLLLANIELQTGKLEQALNNARKLHVDGHKEFAVAHLIAARALHLLQRLDEAAAEYERFVREAPDDPRAAEVRATLKTIKQRP